MKNEIVDVIKKYRMLESKECVYVAVSGGLDSVSLLALLQEVKNTFGITLGVLHINHALRGAESDKDEYFVKRLAKKYNMPFHSMRIDVRAFSEREKLSLEDAARKCRYRGLITLAKKHKIKKIAIAHTKNDQAETILMRIIRGTGLKGFRAIHPTFSFEQIHFIRPFISTSRGAIKNYAQSTKLQYRIDLSNKSSVFFRNKVRHELLPLLEQEFNPQMQDALIRMSCTVYNDYDYLMTAAQETYATCCKKEKEDTVIFDKAKFMAAHSALQYRMIDTALRFLNPELVCEYKTWERIVEALRAKKKVSENMGKGVSVETSYRDLVVQRKRSRIAYEYFISPSESVYIKEAGVTISVQEKEKTRTRQRPKGNGGQRKEVIDLDKVTVPLLIRCRKNGDRFRPLGMKGYKKLKDVFINRKVPVHVRDESPLIVSKGDIVWGWNVGLSDSVKVTAQSRRLLEITVTVQEGVNG